MITLLVYKFIERGENMPWRFFINTIFVLFLLISISSVSFAAETTLPSGYMKVTAFAVEGNKHVATEDILSAVPFRIGSMITPNDVQESLKSIYALGYFSDVKAKTKPFEDGVELIFEVTENPILEGILIQGNSVIPTDKILSIMNMPTGKIFNYNEMDKALKRVEDYYASQGYTAARIMDASLSPSGYLLVTIAEGKIQAIKILGNHRTVEHVIRRELTVKPGDIFNYNKVKADINKLYDMNIFSDVGVMFEPGTKPGEIFLDIDVKEKKTGSVTFGAGYSTAYSAIGMISLSDNNMFGRAQTMSIGLQFGAKQSYYSISFYDPNFNDHNMSFAANLYNYRTYGLLIGGYTTDEKTAGFNVSFGFPIFDKYTRQTITPGYERVHLSTTGTVNPNDQYDRPNGSYRSLTYTLSRDTRDQTRDPRQGYFASASISQTNGFLGGSSLYSFEKVIAEFRDYIPLDKSKEHVFAGRLMGGTSIVPSGKIMPVYYQYYVGGQGTVRGITDNKYYGRYFAIGNFEYRFPFIRGTRGALFTDIGDAWGGNSDWPNFKLHAGVGMGIMLNTPFGPVRIDGAYSSNHFKGYFGMGNPF